MVDMLRIIVKGMVHGVQDSVVGMLRVYSISKEADALEEQKLKTQQSPPRTVLARRRAERLKTNPSSVKKQSPPKLFQRIVMCCFWNGGVFWLSLLVFYGAVLPGLEFLTQKIIGNSSTYGNVWSYVGPVLSWAFSAFWVLPLFLLSKIVNGFWFQDIADCAFRTSRGRPRFCQGFSALVADILFSLTMQGLFLIQGMLAKLLPIHGIGEVVYILHMCLLYSLYAFEYTWFNMSLPVHKRVSRIEHNWPYFMGFGLPLALLTSLPSSFFVSGCVFSILFPLFIISADAAKPDFQTAESPKVFPLKLFSGVIYIANKLFEKINRNPPNQAVGTPKKVSMQEQSQH